MRNLVNLSCAETFHQTAFGEHRKLRPYQLDFVLGAEKLIMASHHGQVPEGLPIVSIMARQAGKNESHAHLECRVLSVFSAAAREMEIVKTAPTWRPQLLISKNRLKSVLKTPFFEHVLQPTWHEGYTLAMGNSKLYLLSCDPSASSVGHTASAYLSVDESQDINKEHFEKVFRPMCSSTGAPFAFSGTEWAKDSLLHQERIRAEELQKALGYRLVWVVPWWRVAEAPGMERYGRFVESLIGIYGADHILIVTHYNCEPVDSAGSMFTIAELGNCISEYSRQLEPRDNAIYVAGVDFASVREDDEKKLHANPELACSRDSTVACVAELTWRLDLRLLRKIPTLRIVDWFHVTEKDPALAVDELYRYLFERWRVARVCLDATGVGDSPSATIHRRRPCQSIELVVNAQVKSRLGHSIVGAVKSGRLMHYRDDGREEFKEFFLQARFCRRHEVRAYGQMSWGAPRTKFQGQSLHDDFVLAAAYALEAGEQHLAQVTDTGRFSQRSVLDDFNFGDVAQ